MAADDSDVLENLSAMDLTDNLATSDRPDLGL
jgi:hypothetical protein